MQNTNLEYRVGDIPLSGRLYAGFVRKDSGKWEGTARDVTDQALAAVGQKLVREGRHRLIPLPDGRMLRLSAEMTDPDVTEGADAQH
ncbi:DUF7446 family protein [Pantoea cypripedii]|uniref:Uncharacterized protein n=1 Tax=Pantoea cypripedii TaxID=55209 RepID=A0A1X1EY00_PANCY|nr:hypothetical protein [Pantoea cypripedii]ORM94910.1 hypothetical protein HA50_16790 [Pantoea cypripedii]